MTLGRSNVLVELFESICILVDLYEVTPGWRLRKSVQIGAFKREEFVYWCRTELLWKVDKEWKSVIFSD